MYVCFISVGYNIGDIICYEDGEKEKKMNKVPYAGDIKKVVEALCKSSPYSNINAGIFQMGDIQVLWGTTASVTLNATAGEYDYVNTTVTFSPAFASAPTVIASPSAPNTPGVSAYVGSAPTTTTVLLQASINLPAHPANTTCKIAWIAIGKL